MDHRWIGIVALALAGCSGKPARLPPGPGPAGAEGPRPDAGQGKTAATLRESVEYYDGSTRRKLWLSPDLVAEFDPSEAGRDAVLLADPGAVEVEQPQESVRIWRTRAPVLTGARTGLSPVLHEGSSPGLPMRALPGGVVATFPGGWDRARIDAWLGAKGLRVQEVVDEAGNMYLVATPPGLESLRVADELHETGELVDATPNFWRQSTPR